MLGFAMRAGQLVLGADAVCNALRGGGVKLVLLLSEASEGTSERIKKKCDFYKTELLEINECAADIGRLLGKTYAPMVIAVLGTDFAREIGLAVKGAPENQAEGIDTEA